MFSIRTDVGNILISKMDKFTPYMELLNGREVRNRK